MEKLSILLIFLFIILCIGQIYSREAFATADISSATVTMSLSDLLYYSGTKAAQPVASSSSIPYTPDKSLDSYLFLKNEMTREFKNKLKESAHSANGCSMNLVNVEPPSVMQGSSYMETVPLKVPASCSQ